jgi:uncharacterized membrane protein YphA (DoxX/SURF4 family)
MTRISNGPTSTRWQRTGSALTTLAGVLLVASGLAKLAGVPPVVQPLYAYGFTHTVPLVGALEVLSGVLLLIPKTRSFGLVFASAFLGGALATHVQHHEARECIPAFFVLALVWGGVSLRHPITLWSFRSTPQPNDGITR